ncbi:hypothetical protein OrNV_gp131 [Oryctes rhinoceros nudivirus]|uniref:Uncharacterized protein n=1 Tax=Oryctes rhinoceros nudivirus TaxID=92521 RepID=B7SVF2_9VIRU|nr:hypothetical protein OrNV_gp131 [Oryctes rhinoceros nudivirus]ACH96261.1 unknown [Oryctes rhinoceros nudivirus]
MLKCTYTSHTYTHIMLIYTHTHTHTPHTTIPILHRSIIDKIIRMNINTVNSTTFTNARNINNTILKALNSKVSAMYIIWSSSYIRMQLLYTDINELIFHTVYVPCANTICIQAYIHTHTHTRVRIWDIDIFETSHTQRNMYFSVCYGGGGCGGGRMYINWVMADNCYQSVIDRLFESMGVLL